MRRFFKNLLTGVDNQTYDLGKVLLTGGSGVMLFAGAKAGWHGSLDYIQFGTGLGLMVGGFGAHNRLTPQPPCQPEIPGEAP